MSDSESDGGSSPQVDLEPDTPEEDSEADEEWAPAQKINLSSSTTRGRGRGRGRPPKEKGQGRGKSVEGRGGPRKRGRPRGRGRGAVASARGRAASEDSSGQEAVAASAEKSEPLETTLSAMAIPAEHTSTAIFVCEVCDVKFDEKTKLLEHKQKSHASSAESGAPAATTTSSDAATDERRKFLSKYTDEQILAKLAERGAAFVCLCGVIFKDQTLYYLHRGCHNTNDPQKCSFCGYTAKDWYDFHTHFLVHKNTAK